MRGGWKREVWWRAARKGLVHTRICKHPTMRFGLCKLQLCGCSFEGAGSLCSREAGGRLNGHYSIRVISWPFWPRLPVRWLRPNGCKNVNYSQTWSFLVSSSGSLVCSTPNRVDWRWEKQTTPVSTLQKISCSENQRMFNLRDLGNGWFWLKGVCWNQWVLISTGCCMISDVSS